MDCYRSEIYISIKSYLIDTMTGGDVTVDVSFALNASSMPVRWLHCLGGDVR